MINERRQQLLLSLEESVRMLQRTLRKAALEMGLTGPQFGFLRLLQESRTAKISELASAAGVGASSISGIVARLEKLDLIYRNRSSEDRRVVDVHITEKGERLVLEVMRARIGVLETFYQHLTEDELASAAEILKGSFQEASQRSVEAG